MENSNAWLELSSIKLLDFPSLLFSISDQSPDMGWSCDCKFLNIIHNTNSRFDLESDADRDAPLTASLKETPSALSSRHALPPISQSAIVHHQRRHPRRR